MRALVRFAGRTAPTKTAIINVTLDALMNLCGEAGINEQVVQSGCLDLLIDFCRSKDANVAEHAFTVMAVIALHGDERGIFAKRLIPVLTEALVERGKEALVERGGGGGASMSVMLSAVTVFRYLARSVESVEAMVEQKVIGKLTNLLPASMGDAEAVEVIQMEEAVVSFLSNLATHEDGRQALVQSSVVAHLVRVCKAHRGLPMASDAASTMAALAFDAKGSKEQCLQQIVEEGGVPFVAKLIYRIAPSSPTSFHTVTQALMNLTSDENVRTRVMHEGVLQAMLHACEVENDPTVLRTAATALRNLSLKKQCRGMMADEGTTASLVMVCDQMLQLPSSRDTIAVLQYAVQTICNLSYAVDSRAKVDI
jgi:hypothetical protein